MTETDGGYSFQRQARSSGLVLGRKTLSRGRRGPARASRGSGQTWSFSLPKYVGSTTLSGELEWNAIVLRGETSSTRSRSSRTRPTARPVRARGAASSAPALAEQGLVDEYEVYLNPLVWGSGNVHVLGDRGTVRMALDDRTAVRLWSRTADLACRGRPRTASRAGAAVATRTQRSGPTKSRMQRTRRCSRPAPPVGRRVCLPRHEKPQCRALDRPGVAAAEQRRELAFALRLRHPICSAISSS